MNKRDIFLVYLGGLFISISYGIIFTIPLFIASIGGDEITSGWVFSICGVGTIIAVFISKYLFKIIRTTIIVMLGSLLYALGSAVFLFVNHVYPLLFICPFFLGLGWGLYFNSAPYLLSMFASDKNRSTLFSYLSAFTVLGSGCAPVFIKYVWQNDINFTTVFTLSCVMSLLSCLAFNRIRMNTSTKVLPQKSMSPTYKIALETKVIYPLLMVFIGACIVTIILNFQTTFANKLDLNYASFFVIYSSVTVISRLALGKYIATLNQYYLTINLLIIMTISLFSFQITMYSMTLYYFSAGLFAFSYGLLYPTIQAIAANLASDKYRSDILSYFTLLYFIGLYAFPPIGGYLIIHFGYTNTLLIISLLSTLELILSVMLLKSVSKKILILSSP